MKAFAAVLLTVLLPTIVACSGGGQDNAGETTTTEVTELTTFAQKSSYAVGADIANSIGRYPFAFHSDGLLNGLQDQLGDGEAELTEEQQQAAMDGFRQKMMAQQGPPDPAAEKEQIDREMSYALGMDIGLSMARMAVKVDGPALAQGLADALNGKESLLTSEESTRVLNEFRQASAQAEQERRTQQGEENKTAGAEFLAENATKEGVQVTESGLQYKVLTPGDGAHPGPTDKVKVHYEGTLIDGTVFDSSYKRGEPISFPLNGVIPGWTEGVQLMPVGSKYEFYIPGELAYGERGAGADIGPNATLIFVVELLAIEE